MVRFAAASRLRSIHKLRLLHSRNHHAPSLWISSEILARHNATSPRLAIRLLMEFNKAVGFGVILEDDETTRVGAYDRVICADKIYNIRIKPIKEKLPLPVDNTPLVPPVNRKAARERIDPNTS